MQNTPSLDPVIDFFQAKEESLKTQKAAFKKLQSSINRYEKIVNDILHQRDQLEASGMKRDELIHALSATGTLARLLKATTVKHTQRTPPAPVEPSPDTTPDTW
ncbi:hypothetical protein [Arcanobacterium ihumii]|uniref:hypothetical protein n=1 Tax=Arcanobacterium ihumii TaxID=2138162 RepID=UPI000F5426FC|nr:hypothetical protein [Arcanobacterium ihumii]